MPSRLANGGEGVNSFRWITNSMLLQSSLPPHQCSRFPDPPLTNLSLVAEMRLELTLLCLKNRVPTPFRRFCHIIRKSLTSYFTMYWTFVRCRWDSNPQLIGRQPIALPIELQQHCHSLLRNKELNLVKWLMRPLWWPHHPTAITMYYLLWADNGIRTHIISLEEKDVAINIIPA